MKEVCAKLFMKLKHSTQKFKINDLKVFKNPFGYYLVMILSFMVALYLFHLQYCYFKINREYRILLNDFTESLSTSLRKDFCLLNDLLEQFKNKEEKEVQKIFYRLPLEVIKNLSVKKSINDTAEAKLKTLSNDNLVIQKNDFIVKVDLFSIRQSVTSIIPYFIGFNIYSSEIENQSTFKNFISLETELLNIEKEKIFVRFFIKNEFMYLQQRKVIFDNLLLYLTVSIPMISIIYLIFKKINISNIYRITILKNDLKDLETEKQRLINNIEGEEKYYRMISKALKDKEKTNALAMVGNNNSYIDNKSLFSEMPIQIYSSQSSTTVNISILLNTLKKHLNYLLSRSNLILELDINSNDYSLKASSESIYQLFLSLLMNLTILCKGNTAIKITMKSGKKLELVIYFKSFYKEKDELIAFCKNKELNIFILNLEQVIKGFELLKFKFKISADDGLNIFNIYEAKDKIVEEKKKVIILKEYLKND